MSKLVSRPFREAHFDLFEASDAEREKVKQSLNFLCMLGKQNLCAIYMLDGRIVFIGGCTESLSGVAEIFIYPSKYATKYPKTYFKEAKWWVDHLKTQYRRLQCWGENTEVSRRWLKHLGFTLEGELLSYTVDGDSMLIWGKV